MTSAHLILESTRYFPQSEIQPVFRFLGKYLVNPDLYAIISPRGEKSGLAAIIAGMNSWLHVRTEMFLPWKDHDPY